MTTRAFFLAERRSGTYLKEQNSKKSKNEIINKRSVSKFKEFSKLAHYLRPSR
jgi:hypothetical protein